jgi:hypothetical protein
MKNEKKFSQFLSTKIWICNNLEEPTTTKKYLLNIFMIRRFRIYFILFFKTNIKIALKLSYNNIFYL